MNESASHRSSGIWKRWYFRLPVKWALFSFVTFFVLFPNPAQFARHVSHVRNMQAMIDPEAPELQDWVGEIRQTGEKPQKPLAPGEIQKEIERFVLDKVKYEWDWNLWGSADYMPTVHEMFEKAKEFGGQVEEDCDGRAVMAASLMAALGYKPTLVTDFRHVWVTTPEGAWMGPGEAAAVRSTAEGNRINLLNAVCDLPASLSYGIAVFPFVREMIILMTAFLLMLRRRTLTTVAAVGLVLLIQGLLFLRLGFFAPRAVSRSVSSWPAWVGLFHVLCGFGVLMGFRRRRTSW